MAPILSLPRESLDRIREAIAPSLVSIWQVDSSSGSKVAFRSGFVYDSEIGKCTILTLKKGLDIRRNVFVQFENGERFEGSGTLSNKESNLFAILVSGLRFEPRKVSNSEHEAHQCEEVVHMGMFDEEKAKFNFSSGSVGSVGHTVIIRKKKFTRFSHCCSQNLHLIGGPVFNLQSKLVGVNYSQREGKNLFFALNLAQLDNEVEMLFGKNMEHAADFMKGIEIHKAKRRKKK